MTVVVDSDILIEVSRGRDRDILAKSGQISPQQSQLYNTLGAKTLANLQQGGIDPRQTVFAGHGPVAFE